MNPVLEQILQTGNTTSATGETIKVHSQISDKEGELLQQIISKVRPKFSLEIGLAYGIASLYICEALAKVQAERHIIIDPFQHQGWKGIGFHNLKRAGYEKMIEFHEAPSFRYSPSLRLLGFGLILRSSTGGIRSTTS